MAYLLVCASLLFLAGNSLAAAPTCKRINDCACTPTDVANATGVVNFYPLVSSAGAKPMYMVNGTSQQTKQLYTFNFNPCMGFTIASTNTGDNCAKDLMCQTLIMNKTNLTYNLGAVNSGAFAYVNTSLFVYYYSKVTNNRTSEVELICDENQATGKFEFVAEPRTLYYQFKFTSMCACPGKCPNKTLANSDWFAVDSCSYVNAMNGLVMDLHKMEAPLKITVDKDLTYYYNPCSGPEMEVFDKKCSYASLCEEDSSTPKPSYKAVSRKDPKVIEEAGGILLRYPTVGAAIDVKLICDQSATAPVVVTASRDHVVLRTRDACPREL